MNHSAFASLNSTRFVRLLSDMNASDIKVPQTQFAEKFAQMLHFSSISQEVTGRYKVLV